MTDLFAQFSPAPPLPSAPPPDVPVQITAPGSSGFSDLLTQAPVRATANPTTPAQNSNPFTAMLQTLGVADDEPDADEDTGPELMFTDEEIEVKAESSSEMWANLIALMVTLLNQFAAKQKLMPGDRQLIQAHERAARAGNVPVYGPNDPYHEARYRYDRYLAGLDESEQEAMLTDGQKTLLQRAFVAHLQGENIRGKLGQPNIYGTIAEHLIVKAMPAGLSLLGNKLK